MKKRTIYTFFFSLLSICLWAQPTANFTVNTTETCEGEAPFVFTDASTGNVLTYLWDFNDGSTSSEQNPTYLYTNPGTYEVCLTVTDDLGVMDTFCQANLLVNSTTYLNIDVTICGGELYLHPCTQQLVGGGIHQGSCNPGMNGCDTILTLNVTELPLAQSDETVNYCVSDGCFNYVDGNCYTAGLYNIVLNGQSYLGCDSIVNLNVIEFTGPIGITGAEVFETSCPGANDGGVCITEISCGQSPFTYSWSNGETGSCASNMTVGNYEVTVTDDNGMTAVEIYTVTEPAPIQVSNLIVTDVTCGGANDGSINFEVIGGTPPYTYMPSNLTDLAAGNYSFTVTDNNSCTMAQTVIINEPLPIQLSVTTLDGTCGNADGAIDLSVTGGTSPYMYSWNDGLFFVQDPANLNPGLYYVDVTDANGCLAELDVVVGGGLIVNYNVSSTTCEGLDDGAIELLVSGGTEPYTYDWAAPQPLGNIGTVTNLSEGFYSVTVTDDTGCSTIVNDIYVEDASPITATVSVTNASCGNSNGNIDVTVEGGTGGYSYNWDNGAVTQDISDLVSGDYNLTITDVNGCTHTLIAAVGESLDLDAISTGISCNGESDAAINLTVLNGQAPYEYLWSNGQETEDLSGLAAGSYTVTVTDATACSAILNVVITDPAAISFSISNTGICAGEIICIDASTATGGTAPYSYLWSDGGTDVINCFSAGDYSLTITDANGCTFASGTISIIESPLLEMQTNIGCVTPGQADGSITVSVTGGIPPYLYEWENGLTTSVINNLTNGSYSITVTDANGCTVTDNILLGIIEAMGPDTLGCAGGAEVFVIAPTAVSYSWEPAAFLDNPTASSTWASSMTDSTLFTVTVTDANGCEDTGSMWVEFPDGPGVVLFPTNPDCGTMAGSIDLFVACGNGFPYTYDWADLPGTDDPANRTGLDVGTYEVTVTDDNGLTTMEAVTLSGSNPINVTITGAAEACEGEELVLCAPNTVGATYSWTGPSGFAILGECFAIPDVGIGQEGCYTVVITDTNGCTGEGTFCVEVVLNNEMISNIIADTTICAGGSAQLLAHLGANTNTTFEWTPGAELNNSFILTPTATPSATTTFVFTTTDNSSGCQASDSMVVNVIPDCMWPGDTDTNKVVNNFDLLNIGLAYDSIGPIRAGGNMLWVGQPAVDWMQTIPSGPNYKHIDSDGNGLIDANDTLAITANWGEMHNFTGDPNQQYVHDYPQVDGFVLNAPFYVEADTLIEGMEMSLPIILGEEMNIAEDVYGLAYSLTYDPDYIVNGSVAIGFNTSWLGENDNNMIAVQRDFPAEGRVDIAMTRIDGTNISDYGQLAQLFITVEDDILFAPGGGGGSEFFVDDAVFNITNVLVINSEGEEIPVIPTETTAPVETTTSSDDIILSDLISIYPNPAKDHIWVTAKSIKMESIRLYDLNGRLIRSTSKPSLDVQNIATGMYLLKIQTEAGVHVEKVTVE